MTRSVVIVRRIPRFTAWGPARNGVTPPSRGVRRCLPRSIATCTPWCQPSVVGAYVLRRFRRLVDSELLVDAVREPGIHEDENDEDVDGTLLGHPETERHAADGEFVQRLDEHDAHQWAGDEPDRQEDGDSPNRARPVAVLIERVVRTHTRMVEGDRRPAAGTEARR